MLCSLPLSSPSSFSSSFLFSSSPSRLSPSYSSLPSFPALPFSLSSLFLSFLSPPLSHLTPSLSPVLSFPSLPLHPTPFLLPHPTPFQKLLVLLDEGVWQNIKAEGDREDGEPSPSCNSSLEVYFTFKQEQYQKGS